jgi:hypothetical protein
MQKLANEVNGVDVFVRTSEEQIALVQEYNARNERTKDDEKWLKDNKPVIAGILAANNAAKMDFGNVRASIVVPDTSKFDQKKLVAFLVDRGSHSILEETTTITVNEEKLGEAVESGEIDLDLMKAAAWVESTGTPRLTVKKVG